jgi:hypothetical protein
MLAGNVNDKINVRNVLISNIVLLVLLLLLLLFE